MFQACSIEVTYHEYDSVGEIKVPNDVIEKAGGEVSDDKEDKEDKDDDKKRINRQSRVKNLARNGTAIRFRSTIKFLSFRAVWQIWKPQV